MTNGNKTSSDDLLSVLLALKQNIFNDLNVAEICKVIKVVGDTYHCKILNNNMMIECKKFGSITATANDLVLVIFTNSDYKINLARANANQDSVTIDSKDLHNSSYGLIIASTNSGSGDVGTKVYVSGEFVQTFNADTKVSKTGDSMSGNLQVGYSSIGTNGYIQGTWLQSTNATENASWSDVWVNGNGWLYKRSKANIKSDLGITSISDYTNDEQAIGKWIDNKIIYRKVIIYEQPLMSNVDTMIGSLGTAIDTVIKIDDVIRNSSNEWWTSEYHSVDGTRSIETRVHKATGDVYFTSYNESWGTPKVIVIVEYTKQ